MSLTSLAVSGFHHCSRLLLLPGMYKKYSIPERAPAHPRFLVAPPRLFGTSIQDMMHDA